MASSTNTTLLLQRARTWTGQLGWHALCLPIAASCVFPLVWMLSSSLKTQQTVFSDFSLIPAVPHIENYVKAWTQGRFGIYFVNSLLYTCLVVLGVVTLAAMAAYAFSRFTFRGSGFLYKLVLSTMLIPIPGAFVALYILLNQFGLIDQGAGEWLPRLGYVLPQINGGLPFGIFILKPFFDGIPKELEESAEVDGCGVLGVFLHIMIPLARPALGVVALLTALSAWNEFLLAYLVFSRPELMPLQRGLLAFHGQHITEYPLLMAAMVISILPIVAIYLVMQRNII
ncbi:MAG: carbohydrate ABC transporter permease, partial [Candidatus Omnitrophica bacterium]|nr:carbohydrate ABC transporter permease [Candidatus Omnitrophota bacterium]